MQIPMGNFGNLIAEAPQAVNVPRLDAGQGLQALGQAGMQIGASELALDRERIVQAQRARLSNTLATTDNALKDAHDSVAQGVLDGSIPSDQAAGEFQNRATKIKSDNLSGVHRIALPHIDACHPSGRLDADRDIVQGIKRSGDLDGL